MGQILRKSHFVRVNGVLLYCSLLEDQNTSDHHETNSFLEFASKQALLSALRKNEIEGIFMDKYMASYMLYKQNDSNFKVFKDYEEKIPYELAYRDSPLFRDAFERETCARNLLQKSFVDSYLMKYLKPVVVGIIHTSVIFMVV